ncbi:reverse transcriptase domain-containing protein [Tanacetum coccineum]
MLIEVGKFSFPVDFVFLEMEEESKVPLILGRPFLHTANAVIRVKPKQLNLGVGTERMTFHRDSSMIHYYFNDDTCFSIDVIDEILEEYFDALLNEDSKILYSIEGTILEEKLFSEFDEFMAMTRSLEERPMDLELKPLPDNLEYPFLEKPLFLPVIISSRLSEENKNKLVSILKRHKQAFAWKITDIPGICPSSKHKIQLLEDKKPVVRKQRRLNPNIQEVSLIHCVPKKGGIIVVTNEKDELFPTRTVIGWCMLAIFHDMIEESVEVTDDFFVFGNSFDHCLNNLNKMLQRCKDANLVLNWEKYHFMVKEGIVLGHKVSGAGLEVDKANINVISKLTPRY